MKATGIVRKVDNLGRVVLPKELRKAYNIDNGEPMEMYLEEETIVLKKYQAFNPCIITGKVSENNLSLVDGKIIVSKEGFKILEKEIEKYHSKLENE